MTSVEMTSVDLWGLFILGVLLSSAIWLGIIKAMEQTCEFENDVWDCEMFFTPVETE